MRKLYFTIFAAFIITGLAGCKLDPPVYPSSVTTNQATTANSNLSNAAVKGTQKIIPGDSLSHAAPAK